MDHDKVQAIIDWPVPRSAKALHRFLGLAGYYQKFIKDFGSIAAPITTLLKKDSFTWFEATDHAFQAIKKALTTAPVLQLPDFCKSFIFECDALSSRFGAVLHQGSGVLTFFSKLIAPRHAKLEGI